MLVEHYEGMGFEAWRQFNKRFNSSGGEFELDMMPALLNPTAAASLPALPGVVDRFERDLRTYECKACRALPEEWKLLIFTNLVPASHRKEMQHKFRMGVRDYATLSAGIRAFSQEAWH